MYCIYKSIILLLQNYALYSAAQNGDVKEVNNLLLSEIYVDSIQVSYIVTYVANWFSESCAYQFLKFKTPSAKYVN